MISKDTEEAEDPGGHHPDDGFLEPNFPSSWGVGRIAPPEGQTLRSNGDLGADVTVDDVLNHLVTCFGGTREELRAAVAGLLNVMRLRLIRRFPVDELQSLQIETQDGFAFEGLSRSEIVSAMVSCSGLSVTAIENILYLVESFFVDQLQRSVGTLGFPPIGRITLVSTGTTEPVTQPRYLRKLKQLAEEEELPKEQRKEYRDLYIGSLLLHERKVNIRFGLTWDYFGKAIPVNR